MGNMIPHGDRLHECTPGCPESPERSAKISKAPWTDVEVDNLNRWQREAAFHPFTCEIHSDVPLHAFRDGWACSVLGRGALPCGYRQDWAHVSMADGTALTSTLDMLATLRGANSGYTGPTRAEVDEATLVSVVMAIGNSDDRLSQADWALYCDRVDTWVENCEDDNFIHVHGRWHSLSNAPYQNAAWSFSIHPSQAEQAKWELSALARTFEQYSIAWTQGETTFVEGLPTPADPAVVTCAYGRPWRDHTKSCGSGCNWTETDLR